LLEALRARFDRNSNSLQCRTYFLPKVSVAESPNAWYQTAGSLRR
jgi:hypothetical protein